jgi:glutathione S-transferase
MPAKFYSLALSHPSQAARVMLELKGVEHELHDLLPGMHPLQLRAAGFRRGTVPALKIDGKRIQGSVQISHFLERLAPQPPLFPADPTRHAVEEAEAWGERELQPIPRRIFRWGTVRAPELRRWVAQLSGIPAPGVAATLNAPVAHRFARLSGASDEAVRANLEALPGMLDRVDRWIAEGILGGTQTNAADCQIASTVRVLLAYSDLESVVAGRPCAELAVRLFPRYPEPIPLPLPASWIPAP